MALSYQAAPLPGRPLSPALRPHAHETALPVRVKSAEGRLGPGGASDRVTATVLQPNRKLNSRRRRCQGAGGSQARPNLVSPIQGSPCAMAPQEKGMVSILLRASVAAGPENGAGGAPLHTPPPRGPRTGPLTGAVARPWDGEGNLFPKRSHRAEQVARPNRRAWSREDGGCPNRPTVIPSTASSGQG